MALDAFRGIHLLLGFKNPQVRGSIRDAAKKAGALSVSVVENTDEAKYLARNQPFNLVIMDEHLGPDGGVKFCQYLRWQNGPICAAPFILLLNDPDKEHVARLLAQGINSFITPNVNTQSLLKIVHALKTNPGDFVVSQNYRGPCRRRSGSASYAGPERRVRPGVTIPSAKLRGILAKFGQGQA